MLDSAIMPGTNIITASYRGSLGATEMKRVREQLAEVVAEHGSARLLVEFGEIELTRIEPAAWWEDLRTIAQIDHVDRYAVLADQRWMERLIGVADALAPFELRVFETSERDAAFSWLTR